MKKRINQTGIAGLLHRLAAGFISVGITALDYSCYLQ
jgi:hypothetical protein